MKTKSPLVILSMYQDASSLKAMDKMPVVPMILQQRAMKRKYSSMYGTLGITTMIYSTISFYDVECEL